MKSVLEEKGEDKIDDKQKSVLSFLSLSPSYQEVDMNTTIRESDIPSVSEKILEYINDMRLDLEDDGIIDYTQIRAWYLSNKDFLKYSDFDEFLSHMVSALEYFDVPYNKSGLVQVLDHAEKRIKEGTFKVYIDRDYWRDVIWAKDSVTKLLSIETFEFEDRKYYDLVNYSDTLVEFYQERMIKAIKSIPCITEGDFQESDLMYPVRYCEELISPVDKGLPEEISNIQEVYNQWIRVVEHLMKLYPRG